MIYAVLEKNNVNRKPEDLELLNEKKSSDLTRRGSAGIVDSMMLLKSHQSMHVPYTQVVPASRHHLALSLCSITSPIFEEYNAFNLVYATGSTTYDRRHA